MKPTIELSVIIPARNEAATIGATVRGVRTTCERLGVGHEILVVDGDSVDDTRTLAAAAGARVIRQTGRGYGAATGQGMREAQGDWALTLDADLSHPPQFIESLWAARDGADLVVASRYVPGGYARMPRLRRLLSWTFNRLFAAILAAPVRDLSSGYRLYRRAAFLELRLDAPGFDFLPQSLVEFYGAGCRVRETPFYYRPRRYGVSNARLLRFGASYLRTMYGLWRRRNAISAADYDFRGFYSRHPFQRYWQRRRYRIITDFLEDEAPILDVGAGSGVFAAQYPGVTALDLEWGKMRFLSQFNPRVVCASAGELPFADESFAAVVCSELIEHVKDERILREGARVLRPGGVLIVGTPDYGSWEWPLIERAYRIAQPNGYADQHINPYTRARLRAELESLGLTILAERSILNAELLLKARKPAAGKD